MQVKHEEFEKDLRDLNLGGLDELSERNLGKCVKVDFNQISNSIINHIKSKKRVKNLELIDYVSNNFNWDKVSNKYIKVFKKIV